ncbi:MAG: DNA modification methylase [Pseudomonadota bacterium]
MSVQIHYAKPSHGKNDLFPNLKLVWLEISQIKDAPRRTRRALEKQTVSVKKFIERFGNRIPILVDGKHHVIDGHARLEAARLLGAEQMPCVIVDDLPEHELRHLALSLNKLQETGIWDEKALSVEIAELIALDGDLDFPGFDVPEIEAMAFKDLDDDEDDPADNINDVTSPDAPLITTPGDAWVLGDHRLICGSSRDSSNISTFLDGDIADAVFTDPPYNLKVNGHIRSESSGFKEFAEGSGEISRDEFLALLIDSLGSVAAYSKPGAVIFACMDWRHHVEMDEALAKLGLTILNICFCSKRNGGMGSLYRSRHEFVFVAKKPSASHMNNAQLGRFGRNRTNVWEYAGATGGAKDTDDNWSTHLTVKPVRLVMDALLDVTAPGDLVLDPFLGSGTTLMAAERTGRRCVGVEIEPTYVDLTIRRWQNLTGRDALHADTGVPFNAVEKDLSSDATFATTTDSEGAS